VRACTIVAAAELPYARVLADSLGATALTALVLDDPSGALREDEPFDVLRPGDLEGVEPWRLLGRSRRAATRYLEPRLLAHLGAAVLLASDVLVLEPLAALPGDYVTLVPRVLEPVASEDVLADGLFDSGLIGVSAAAGPLLEWWREREDERLRTEADGPHVLDAAVELFGDVHVLRDPTYGVAPWNLHEREVEGARTFRFAGFDPGRPDRLAAQVPELCEDYADRLRAAGWVEHGEGEPVEPLARLANGVAVDGALRDLVAAGISEGVEFGDLTSLDGAHRLLEFANGPAAAGAAQGVTRYLEALRARRLDLQDSFQALEDEDGERFVHWARTDGRREGVPEALAGQPAPEAWSGGGEPPGLGVNVAGFLRSGLGVGEAARLYVAALETAGVPVRAEVVDPGLPQPKRTAFEDRRPAVEYDFNLVCVNASELPGFARRVGAEFFAGKRTIGVWAWEASTVPPGWDAAFALVDEIWTNSEYVTSVLAPASPVPVVTLPQPVLAPERSGDERAARGSAAGGELPLELGDAFTFLFTFDFFSTARRKNPVGLVEAYTRAFEPGDGAQLVIKTFNGDVKPESLAQLERAAAGRADVRVIDRFLPVEQKDALLARADAYVSLHRSEGFGLSLAEAMLLGKPVIATGYSGNLQFMTPANSWLAGYELTRVGEGVEMYPPDALWAEPDLGHAAELMREVRAGGEEVRRRAERGRRDVELAFSPEATGAAMRARLERLAAAVPVSVPGPAVSSQALQDLRDKHAYDRGEGSPGVAQTPGGKALRAVRPYTFHQRELNGRVLKALEEQAQRIDELEEQLRRARRGISDARRKAIAADAKLSELERRVGDE
jgi:glycosyltransferase involved in cell wall biosynthesis